MLENLPEFARPAISWKERALGSNPLDAMPPTVQAWRDGRLLATIAAEHVDRDLGLIAAARCREFLRADRLVAAFDMYQKGDPVDLAEGARRPGESPNQTARRLLKASSRRFPSGTFQRMFEDGYTREREEVMEALVVVQVCVGAPLEVANLPFLVDQGPPKRVIWHAKRFHSAMLGDDSAMVGPLFDSLAEIASLAVNAAFFAGTEIEALMMGLAEDVKDLRRDRGFFLAMRMMGYKVEDHISRLRPDILGQDE